MKIFALPLVLLGLLVPLVHADQTRTSEKPETWLFVRTTPPGAQVFLDGKQLGTSTDLFPVESGVRKLVVKLEGHDSQTQTVTIPAGEVTRVVLKLKKRPGTGRSDAVPKPPGPAQGPDDEKAVAKLNQLGAKLKHGRDGKVKSVSFEGTPVTDADLVHLRNLAALEELDLSGTRITNAGLVHLETLTGLEDLDLSGTQVTNAAVKHLNKLTTLRRLDLEGTQVNGDAWRELFLPGLYWFGYKGPEIPKALPRKLLLVEADGAGEKSVLDLASGETLPLTNKAVHDPGVFTRMGKGDLWYGNNRIVCLRGAKATYLDDRDGFPGEEVYGGHRDATVYTLPEVRRVKRSEDEEIDLPCRFRVTTAEKKHFDVAIISVTKDDDAVLEYLSADNPFRTKWDPTFRMQLAGVAAIDLDTGRTMADLPFPTEDWPDAFELVWNDGRREVLRKHGSPTRVIQLRDVKNFEQATDQALKRFKELDQSGEGDRSGAVSSFDDKGVGPSDARYFAVITNRENLAVVEVIPPKQKNDDTSKGSIKWSVGEVRGYFGTVPPLVTPVRRLPAPDQRDGRT